MKKIILTFVTVFSLVACKKTGYTENTENTNSSMVADSASHSSDSLQTPMNKVKDSSTTIPKDTAVVKIEVLKEQKKLLTEKVAKELDSATRTSIISEIKITQQKIDSTKAKIVSARVKKKVAPQIIRETKIIYQENQQPKIVETAPKITKKGELEILVTDFEHAQLVTKEQISKYDGIVKSEQISSDENKQFDYLKVSVPQEKSEYLIKDLEQNVGKITSRNIEITGEEYTKNSVCHLEITLVNTSEKSAIGAASKSFGGRTLSAVGSGWNVIQEIFLFILPFWPLFLIGGGIYYFLKKKKMQEL